MSTSHRRNSTESHDIGFQLAWHKPSLDTCNTGDASVETSLTSLSEQFLCFRPHNDKEKVQQRCSHVCPEDIWGHLRTSEDIIQEICQWKYNMDQIRSNFQIGSTWLSLSPPKLVLHLANSCFFHLVWCVPERRIDKADAVGLCSTHAWGSSTIPGWKIPFNQAGDHVGKFACELWRRSSLVILPPLSLSRLDTHHLTKVGSPIIQKTKIFALATSGLLGIWAE
jgi:hypothetical protein